MRCRVSAVEKRGWRYKFRGSTVSEWLVLKAVRLKLFNHFKCRLRTSLVVQWLRHHTVIAGGTGLIPSWGPEVLVAAPK